MRITRLELHGFKSFPDRTTFHFGEGISCVVGPNGSGKSNVVDALKWCVGEQSARSLRGAEMSDVIFAGSTDRKPVGYAEVALTLKASEQSPFPGEYAQLHELQVGRRLHRSGASEYFVNHTRVRRRDVVELLLDSGIGNNLYSFIEQGQVDKMITASPAERRTLIDEAAGIARYKARRDEAQQRLVTTSTQLDRAADVLDEMHRRLRVLERQVLVAARFRRLRALVRQGELRLALVKHHALAQDRRALRRELEELKAKEDATRREVLRREEDLQERREELTVSEALASTRRDEVAELDARTRELEATAILHERRASELREEAERASLEVRRQVKLAEEAEAERRAAGDEATALASALEGLAARARDAERAHAAALDAAGRSRAEQARVGEALEVAVSARGKADAELAVAESVVRDRQQALDRARAAVIDAERARLDAGRQVDAAVAAAREVEGRIPALDEALRGAEAELAAALGAEAEAVAARGAVEAARDAAVKARTERQKERERAAERGRRWLDALRAERSEGWSRREREAAAAVTALERRLAAERTRARAEREARAKAALEEVRARNAARIEAEAKRAREATATLAEAERREGEATRIRGAAAGKLEAAKAELDAVRRRLAAPAGEGALLRQVLGEPVSLLALADPAAREEVVRRLGDDAGRAVVRDRGKLGELLRRADRPVAVWVWPAGEASPEQRVRWVGTLEEALAHPGPSAGPNFRSDGAGGLRLGPPGALGELVGAERRATESLATAEGALEAATRELEGARERRERATQAVQDARAAERAARLAADTEQQQAAAAIEAERGAEDERARRAESGEVEALREALAKARAEADARAATAVAAAQAVLEEFLARPVVEEDLPDPGPLRAQAERAAATAREVAGRRDRARSARQQVEAGLAEARARLEARRNDQARADRGHAEAERAVARLVEELAAAHERREAAAAKTGAALEAEAAARAEVARARSEVASAAQAEREAGEGRSRLELDRVATEERATAAQRRVAEAGRRVEAAREGAELALQQVERARGGSAEATTACDSAREQAAQLRSERAARWDELERVRERSVKLAEGVTAAERALRQQRSRLEEVGRSLEAAGAKVAAAQQELEVLRRGMEDRYQVSLAAWLDRLHARGSVEIEADPEAAEGVSLAGETVEGVAPLVLGLADLTDEAAVVGVVEELDGLRTSLAELGEVHLGAAAEHRELRGRVDELETQRADLEHGLEQIRGAIAKLNRECRERFRETFDVVNDHFKETYPRLVGGGSARLALTDDEDLLETGVDIFVQPPGKRLQNLQLLSGGEKAMTAIALLIALFRVKPSPFCVLDEVDAPLDEANGARFNDMLREMSRRSQFLVVTHNRKTMECADTLYGITMARPGVSKLVSVQLP